ncbi:glycosyltransferase family 39 protein [Aurantibacillus circumpalustris]|uniref:glycosyltransferase family 39 protein n=1 Tax=Aurantibacillus circumpalustris TaxID=3036359 RepID=UPI00295C1B4D|nr:glycosyltransferase family 39 protein [Aurantibacillus circumpalustris]
MKVDFNRYNYFFLLLLLFVIAEIFVNPIGNFPLNDDWSYGKALHYSITKSYTIGNFGAMSLFTHVMWGALFVKLFGFSFTVLRFSTLISVVIGVFFLDRLIFQVTKNKIAAFVACLVLLFNPMYFNLANTYMTDVNFNTLLILATYYAFRFFETKRIIYVLVFFIFSVLLVLLRQFGIIIPVCFLVANFFIQKRKILWITLALSVSILVYYSLHVYESYLKDILPQGSAYKFSGGVHVTDKQFWHLFGYYLNQRYKILMVHVFVYISPVAAYFLISILKSFKVYFSIVISLICTFFVYWFFGDTRFPFGNIFENCWLGPETFHESLSPDAQHLNFGWFGNGLTVVKFFFSSITVITVVLYFISLFKSGKVKEIKDFNPEIVFLICFLFAYAFMIFITESYFDRYFIPLITVSIILLSYLNKNYQGNYQPIIVLVLFFFYVAVFGTRDYLTLNRTRWEAYTFLQETKNASAENVNAGFEVNCWNDLKETWWSDYVDLERFQYLIQFHNEPNFELLKEYEFQRYLPYKKDKLSIFIRKANQ